MFEYEQPCTMRELQESLGEVVVLQCACESVNRAFDAELAASAAAKAAIDLKLFREYGTDEDRERLTVALESDTETKKIGLIEKAKNTLLALIEKVKKFILGIISKFSKEKTPVEVDGADFEKYNAFTKIVNDIKTAGRLLVQRDWEGLAKYVSADAPWMKYVAIITGGVAAGVTAKKVLSMQKVQDGIKTIQDKVLTPMEESLKKFKVAQVAMDIAGGVWSKLSHIWTSLVNAGNALVARLSKKTVEVTPEDKRELDLQAATKRSADAAKAKYGDTDNAEAWADLADQDAAEKKRNKQQKEKDKAQADAWERIADPEKAERSDKRAARKKEKENERLANDFVSLGEESAKNIVSMDGYFGIMTEGASDEEEPAPKDMLDAIIDGIMQH